MRQERKGDRRNAPPPDLAKIPQARKVRSLQICVASFAWHANSLFAFRISEFFVFMPIKDEDLQDDVEISVRSGDAAVLRAKRNIEGLRLDNLEPENELVHSTWESKLQKMAQLLAVDIPLALHEAQVVVELRTADDSSVCRHGGPLICGEVLCSLFDAGLNPTPSAYMELQNFLDENPLPQRWRLCSVCGTHTWSAKGMTYAALHSVKEEGVRMDRWARLSTACNVSMPLVAVSNLNHRQFFRTQAGEKVFAPPRHQSVPRATHEARGEGYSQQETKFDQLSPWQYHAYYWMMAFIYEELLKIYTKHFPAEAPPQRNKFASKNAMNLAQSDWAPNVRSAFSTNFQKVIRPVELAQNLAHYLTSKAPPNHKLCWGFKGLMWHHVGTISPVRACAVHTFATFVSELAIFQPNKQV